MLLSCIIVNFNQTYLLRLCIEALRASKVDFEFEIIVVDNNSHEESVEFLKKMADEGKITLVCAESNLGYGKANNLGVQKARGQYVLILNPDVSVEPSMLQKMVQYMKEHTDTGILAPQLYFYNGQVQDSCRRFMTPIDLVLKRTPLQRFKAFRERVDTYLMVDYDKTRTREVDMVTGACIMMTKSLYNKLGGFDPRYFLFMEDVDLCRRVWGAGYKVIYLPEAKALHYHKRLSGGNIMKLLMQKVFWIHLASAGKYFWKWRGKSLPRKIKKNF